MHSFWDDEFHVTQMLKFIFRRNENILHVFATSADQDKTA